MENYVSQLSNKSLYSQRPKVIHRFPNLTQQDFHIDASFDGIRETGFWANGSEISNEWWFRNSDYETNVSNSILLDQVRLLNSLNLGVPRLSFYRFYLSPMSKINWHGQFLRFRYIMILLSGILKYRGPRKRCFNSQGQLSLQRTFCVWIQINTDVKILWKKADEGMLDAFYQLSCGDNIFWKERLEVGFFSLQIRSYLQKSNFNGWD